MPTFGSLFSGIGGIDLGLERAGWTCRWQVEIDDYCRRVLSKHWPDVPKHGDVRELTGSELEPVDLVAGGFPCQPVSHAGRRRGTADERWLWPEFRRVLGLLRPRFILVENVPGLLTVNGGAAFGEILGDLAALGYDAEWENLPAAAFGAPHLRYRVFLVAYTRGQQWVWQHQRQPRIQVASVITANGEFRDVANADGSGRRELGRPIAVESEQRPAECGRAAGDAAHPEVFAFRSGLREEKPGWEWRGRFGDGDWWATEPSVGQLVDELPPDVARRIRERGFDLDRAIPRVAKGIARRVPWLRSDGNAVIAEVAEWIGERILEAMNAMKERV